MNLKVKLKDIVAVIVPAAFGLATTFGVKIPEGMEVWVVSVVTGVIVYLVPNG